MGRRAAVARRPRRALIGWIAIVALAGGAAWLMRDPPSPAVPLNPPPAAPDGAARKTFITYPDARPLLTDARAQPAGLRDNTPERIEAAWPGWTRQLDADIRARVARGDEDSVVNLWYYGTSFTSEPRATARDIAAARPGGRGDVLAEVLDRRLADLIAAVRVPASERLQFVRTVIERQGIDPSTPAGAEEAQRYVIALAQRMAAENAAYERAVESAREIGDPAVRSSRFATLFEERGLSTDTSLLMCYSIDRALDAMLATGRVARGAVRRVGVIGPGLDFADKTEGHDFYPLQTIQPFALVDSLIRVGLAPAGGLTLVTFDLSRRVNQHVSAAAERARQGEGYLLQLALTPDRAGNPRPPDVVAYWQGAGSRIGNEVPASAPPPGVRDVRMRAVRVRPEVAAATTAVDLNVVIERLALDDDARFDLIVATNVLVYYDQFEQSLALSNIASMLKPGGLFLTNYPVVPPAPLQPAPLLTTPTFWDRERRDGDTLFWFQRQ